MQSLISNKFDVIADKALLEDDTAAIAVKLSSPLIEVNVLLSREEVRCLPKVLVLGKQSRGLRLGTSANSPVHWAYGENGSIDLLIGYDDETWDIGITIPRSTFEEIINEVNGQI